MELEGSLVPPAGVFRTGTSVGDPETAAGENADSGADATPRSVFAWGMWAFDEGFFGDAAWLAFQAAGSEARASVRDALILPFEMGSPEMLAEVVATVFLRHGIGSPEPAAKRARRASEGGGGDAPAAGGVGVGHGSSRVGSMGGDSSSMGSGREEPRRVPSRPLSDEERRASYLPAKISADALAGKFLSYLRVATEITKQAAGVPAGTGDVQATMEGGRTVISVSAEAQESELLLEYAGWIVVAYQIEDHLIAAGSTLAPGLRAHNRRVQVLHAWHRAREPFGFHRYDVLVRQFVAGDILRDEEPDWVGAANLAERRVFGHTAPGDCHICGGGHFTHKHSSSRGSGLRGAPRAPPGLTAGAGGGGGGQVAKGGGRICPNYQQQKDNAGPCSYGAGCKFLHVCMQCQGKHSKVNCPQQRK